MQLKKEIKIAYHSYSKRIHPDHVEDELKNWANEEIKKFNEAYFYLKDPQKRAQYDLEWDKRNRKSKPKPVVDPPYIRLDNVKVGKIRRASFVIENEGDPYSKLWISNPDSWLKVVKLTSVDDIDQLPLKVDIEAEGKEWNKSYTEDIIVKLDEEEAKVKVELHTAPKPVEKKKSRPINQAINQPINQSTYQPINQPIYQPSNQSPAQTSIKSSSLNSPNKIRKHIKLFSVIMLITIFLIYIYLCIRVTL